MWVFAWMNYVAILGNYTSSCPSPTVRVFEVLTVWHKILVPPTGLYPKDIVEDIAYVIEVEEVESVLY